MITEDYVSFEIAKLLKEKGFNELTPLSYSLPYGYESHIPCCNGVDTDFVSRITIQMAMKWLREVHNIDIIINVSSKDESDDKRKYTYAIVSKLFIGTDNVKRTYEESCESAIKYCLEKLI